MFEERRRNTYFITFHRTSGDVNVKNFDDIFPGYPVELI